MPKRGVKGRGKPATKRKIEEVEETVEEIKRSPFEQDVDKIIDFVMEAGNRGYSFPGPGSNLEMMKKCACPALVEAKEDRHPNQTSMVELMESSLRDIETRMHKSLETMKFDLTQVDLVAAKLEETRVQATETAVQKENAAAETKGFLVGKREAFTEKKKVTDDFKKELKTLLKEQEKEQAVVDQLNLAFEGEFKKLTVPPPPPAPVVEPTEGETPVPVEGEAAPVVEPEPVVEKPKPGRRRSVGKKEPTVDDRIKNILDELKLHDADQSFIAALPPALRKALETPGEFGTITLDYCNQFFEARRAHLQAAVDSATAKVTAQNTSITEAEAAQEVALNDRTEATEKNATAVTEMKDATKDMKQKTKDIDLHKINSEETRTTVSQMDTYIRDMQLALQMFTMLRDRTNPPPPAPVVETPAVTEAAPVTEDVTMAEVAPEPVSIVEA